MRTERLSFVIDEDTDKEFQRIMEHFGTENKNETFIKLIVSFKRLYFESQLYRRFIKDATAYEILWEQKGDDENAFTDIL
jgi:hypothetical protein